MKICVVGAGITGAVIAERYASHGHQVTVYEKRDHVAGNCYDYYDENGILVSKYGPHFFHTNNQRVWNYIQQFAEWTPYELRVKSRVFLGDGTEKIVPVPVNIDTVNQLFNLNISSVEEMNEWLSANQIPCSEPVNSEEVALSRVGKRLYELLFKGYTLKQWEKHPKDLGPSVLARIPVRNNWDDRYFTDTYQALPYGGYTKFISNILYHPNITVHLNQDFLELSHEEKMNYDKVYFTGPIDQYFKDSGLPKLEYRSLRFEKKTIFTSSCYQPTFVINEASSEIPYTRTAEYKHLPNECKESSNLATTIIREYSTAHGDPYYPVPNEKNLNLYKEYQQLAEKVTEEDMVYFVGRLASYKYFNMDQAIEVALNLIEENEGISSDH